MASGSERAWCLAGPFPLRGLKPCDLGPTQTDERWLEIFCCHLKTVFLILLSALLAGKELWRPEMACVTNAGPKTRSATPLTHVYQPWETTGSDAESTGEVLLCFCRHYWRETGVAQSDRRIDF